MRHTEKNVRMRASTSRRPISARFAMPLSGSTVLSTCRSFWSRCFSWSQLKSCSLPITLKIVSIVRSHPRGLPPHEVLLCLSIWCKSVVECTLYGSCGHQIDHRFFQSVVNSFQDGIPRLQLFLSASRTTRSPFVLYYCGVGYDKKRTTPQARVRFNLFEVHKVNISDAACVMVGNREHWNHT